MSARASYRASHARPTARPQQFSFSSLSISSFLCVSICLSVCLPGSRFNLVDLSRTIGSCFISIFPFNDRAFTYFISFIYDSRVVKMDLGKNACVSSFPYLHREKSQSCANIDTCMFWIWNANLEVFIHYFTFTIFNILSYSHYNEKDADLSGKPQFQNALNSESGKTKLLRNRIRF